MKRYFQLGTLPDCCQQCLIGAEFGVQGDAEPVAERGDLLLVEARVLHRPFQRGVVDFNGLLQWHFMREKIRHLRLQFADALGLVLLQGGDAFGRHATEQAQAQVQRPVAVAVGF